MLSDLLALNIFHFLLVFARLSVVFLMMPGVSAGYVPTRVRLALAMLVTLVALPLVQDYLPMQPETAAELAKLLVIETLIGGFIGAVIQMIMAALDIAGLVISRSVGLMNAFVDDPVSSAQSAIMPNQPPMTGYILNMVVSALNGAFHIGLRLASPFLVYALVFQVAMGVMARLSPQMNIFFVALPIQMMLGMALLTIALPAMMLVFLNYFDNNITSLLTPGVNGG